MSFKKILIILIIIIILAGGALAAYYYFFSFKEAPEPTSPENGDGDTIVIDADEAIPSQINLLSQEPVISPTVDGGNIKYYSALNGNVFQSSLDGSSKSLLSADILPGIITMIWSPTDKSKVIGLFDQDKQTKRYLYDYANNQSTLLDGNIRYLNWSPDQYKIVYQYYDRLAGINNISIANPDGSGWNNIFQTRIKDLIVEWPKPDQIVMRTRPSGLAQSVIYTIDAAGKNFKKLIDNAYGLTTLWSPNGDKLLYSETDSQGKNLSLKLLNTNNQTTRELDFATLPEKCAWSSNNRVIFCAVPTIIANQSIMPDDYYKGLLEFSDNIYKIDLDTDQKALLLGSDVAAKNIDAGQLLLSNQEDYLIFVNKKDGLLYSLKLP